MEVSIVASIVFYGQRLMQAGVLTHTSRNAHEVKHGL